MQLLRNFSNDYTLQVGLHELHKENLEWQNEIQFWKDELNFYYAVIQKRYAEKDFPPQNLAELEKELIIIHSDELNRVKTELRQMEKLLTTLFESSSVQEEDVYRKRHSNCMQDIHHLKARIKKLKNAIFANFTKSAI